MWKFVKFLFSCLTFQCAMKLLPSIYVIVGNAIITTVQNILQIFPLKFVQKYNLVIQMTM